jgi:hypothetical protein
MPERASENIFVQGMSTPARRQPNANSRESFTERQVSIGRTDVETGLEAKVTQALQGQDNQRMVGRYLPNRALPD